MCMCARRRWPPAESFCHWVESNKISAYQKKPLMKPHSWGHSSPIHSCYRLIKCVGVLTSAPDTFVLSALVESDSLSICLRRGLFPSKMLKPWIQSVCDPPLIHTEHGTIALKHVQCRVQLKCILSNLQLSRRTHFCHSSSIRNSVAAIHFWRCG